jgi:hypothetical protein
MSLQLKNWPMAGIDMTLLEATGEPIEAHIRRASSRETNLPDDQEDRPERPTAPQSSQTQRGRGRGQRPHRPGVDPTDLKDFDEDDNHVGKPRRLEGVVPTKFDGNRSKTMSFLAEFKRFMRINREADIAKDPFLKSNYFLAFFTGPDTEGWVEQQDDWLASVDRDPTILPWRMNEWDIMEREFKKAFVDYAEHEKANEDLRKLRMKDGNVDAYIARFSQLAHRGGHNVNEPELLRLFAQGLPTPLANSCLEQQDPDTFDEWTHAAQRNQKVWLKKQSLKGVFGPTQNQRNPPRTGNPFGGFQWRNQNRGGQNRPNQGQSSSRDPNAMDTSATVRKAVMEADKQKHRSEGRCFECSKQGHIARNCPDRKAKARATTAATNQEVPETTKTLDLTDGAALAEHAFQLSDDARDAFVKKVMMMGEEMGFLEA